MTDQDMRKPIAAATATEPVTVVGYQNDCVSLCVRHAPKNASQPGGRWHAVTSDLIEPMHDLLCDKCGEPIIRAVDLQRTFDMLSLVVEHLTADDVLFWNPIQRAQAIRWAAAMYANASDNDDVRIPARPDFIPTGPKRQDVVQ